MIFKSIHIPVIFAISATSLQASFVGEEGEIPATDPIYSADEAPDSIPALLGILNGQGAQGFEFRGLDTLDNPGPTDRTTLFINDQSDSETYTYDARDAVDALAATLLNQINELGATGFEFAVNFNAADTLDSSNLYAQRDGSTETFEYRLPVSPTTPESFMALLNEQGAEGFEWLGLRAQRDAAANLVFHQLFVNRSSDSGTFAYASGDVSFAADTSLAQFNSFGSQGFRWIFNTTIPGGGGTQNIYVRSSTRSSTFAYNIEDSSATRTDFVAQADAQGALGRYFKTTGTFTRNGVTGGANVYVEEVAALPSAGGIDIASDGLITFVPDVDGSFQLQTSTDLESFTDSGTAQPGTAGTAITFATGAPVTGQRLFFRVVTF